MLTINYKNTKKTVNSILFTTKFNIFKHELLFGYLSKYVANKKGVCKTHLRCIIGENALICDIKIPAF